MAWEDPLFGLGAADGQPDGKARLILPNRTGQGPGSERQLLNNEPGLKPGSLCYLQSLWLCLVRIIVAAVIIPLVKFVLDVFLIQVDP